MAYQRYNGGWIEVICGCMFSGKTEELIRRVKRAQIARQKVQVFQHSLDTRYGEKRIASHSGAHLDALTVQKPADILSQAEMVDKLQAICVVCGASASRTQRLIDGKPAFYEDPVIMVGASEVYEARCRMCHDVPRKEKA